MKNIKMDSWRIFLLVSSLNIVYHRRRQCWIVKELFLAGNYVFTFIFIQISTNCTLPFDLLIAFENFDANWSKGITTTRTPGAVDPFTSSNFRNISQGKTHVILDDAQSSVKQNQHSCLQSSEIPQVRLIVNMFAPEIIHFIINPKFATVLAIWNIKLTKGRKYLWSAREYSWSGTDSFFLSFGIKLLFCFALCGNPGNSSNEWRQPLVTLIGFEFLSSTTRLHNWVSDLVWGSCLQLLLCIRPRNWKTPKAMNCSRLRLSWCQASSSTDLQESYTVLPAPNEVRAVTLNIIRWPCEPSTSGNRMGKSL